MKGKKKCIYTRAHIFREGTLHGENQQRPNPYKGEPYEIRKGISSQSTPSHTEHPISLTAIYAQWQTTVFPNS